MSTFQELQDETYFWLGTTSANRAFPVDRIKRLLNRAKDSFHEDCLRSFPDALTVFRTLTPDLTDTTSYIFSTQTPAIGEVALIVEVRLDTNEGLMLEEAPFSERHRRTGLTYSLLGIGSAVTLYAGRNVTANTPLYLAYIPVAADLVDPGDRPTWLPSSFHDVLSLRAAMLATGSGNEQTMSDLLLETLADREAQARFAFGQRSLTPTTLRLR